MAHPSGDTEHQYSLFQQLLSAATRPSPIKAIFSRDEFEVCYYVHVKVLAVSVFSLIAECIFSNLYHCLHLVLYIQVQYVCVWLFGI